MNLRAPHFDVIPGESSSFLTPGEFVLQLWRSAVAYRRMILGFVCVFVLLAIGYLVITPKQYLATSEMIIDPRKSEDVVPQHSSAPQVDAPVDASVVESEGTVLESENVIQKVIKKLDLVNSPTFADPHGLIPTIKSLTAPVLSRLFNISPTTDYERLRATVEDFQSRLTVKRVGVTYVFDISFLSPDPQEAANVANAVAAAYVDDLLGAKYSARLRASDWMQDRLKALSKQTSDAERTVAQFKRDHSIVSTGGRMIDEQQVGELQSQLTLARAAKANAKAKLDRIQEVLATGKLDLSVADALSNQVIITLRDSYVDLSKHVADLESRLGPDHEAPKRLRADMEQVRASIFEELKRIGEGYKSDYQIASSQEIGINADLSKAVAQSADTNEAEVQLAQLESDAQAYRALYDTFLERFGEVVQQQSFPLTETRLVTEASAPLKKSKPKTLLTLLGAIFAGGLCGFGVGWVRDKTDGSLRSGDQAESVAEAPLIANVPRLERRNREALAREAIYRPLSAFAESIRELRVFLEMQRLERSVQIVAVTSAIPDEGKSTIAVNLAGLMAKSKARILLIDGDLRSRSLTTMLGTGTMGLAEVLQGTSSLEDAIMLDETAQFDFLPAATTRTDSSELLSSPEMRTLLATLRPRYDVIIVDLPPILSVSDAKAVAPVIDGFLLVAEHGRTPVETLSEAVRGSGRIKDRILGIVLNKVAPGGAGSHRGRYASKYLVPA